MTAFVGNIFFEYLDLVPSPDAYVRVCQVFSIDGIGETNNLVDATTFCSGGSMEYIAGLADGAEISIEANYEQGGTDLHVLIAQVKAKAARDYQIVVEQLSPSEAFQFSAIPLSWTLNPSVDGRNTITFSFKITGDITIV